MLHNRHDPAIDIRLAAAVYQVSRMAQLRHLPLSIIQSLIRQHATAPFIGIIGEPTVNVPELKLPLDLLQ